MEKNEAEGKQLIVGRGIKLSGEIQACEKLVVEGEVHADVSGALVLEIADKGLFRGRATVDYAEISGSFEGELTVRDRLMLRQTGQVDGDLRYAEMEIEKGGRVRGTIGELDGPPVKAKETQTKEAPAKASKSDDGAARRGREAREAPAKEEAAVS